MRIIFVSVMTILVFTGCVFQKNRVLVKNDSDMLCTSVVIAVCDSTWIIQSLAPGEEQEFTIVYTRDDAFQISAETADGQILEGRFGYVTHGVGDEIIEIVFTGDSIRFDQSTESY